MLYRVHVNNIIIMNSRFYHNINLTESNLFKGIYSLMHKPRQAIPKSIANMHCIKEAAEAQNSGQADT